ncbi:hypothetical protein TB1_014835 [Malus domestica]
MSHHPQSDQQANGTLSTLLLSGKSLRIGLKFFGPGFFVPAINPSLRLSEAAIEEDTRSQQLSLSLSRPPEAAPWPRSPVFVPDGFNDYSSSKKHWASTHEPYQIKRNSHSPTASFRGATSADLVP